MSNPIQALREETDGVSFRYWWMKLLLRGNKISRGCHVTTQEVHAMRESGWYRESFVPAR
jgi:hypothetical protein